MDNKIFYNQRSRSYGKTYDLNDSNKLELELAINKVYITSIINLWDQLDGRFTSKASILELKIQVQEHKLTYIYNSNMRKLNKL